MESTKRSSSSNNATSSQQSQPTLCSNGCGFFGTADKKGLCSKCFFNDLITKSRQAAQAHADMIMPVKLRPLIIKRKIYKDARKLVNEDDQSSPEAEEKKVVKKKTRCGKCDKKVGLVGFECRCGTTFCGAHRYAEAHGCGFDYKEKGKSEIAKANPVVKADKLERF